MNIQKNKKKNTVNHFIPAGMARAQACGLLRGGAVQHVAKIPHRRNSKKTLRGSSSSNLYLPVRVVLCFFLACTRQCFLWLYVPLGYSYRKAIVILHIMCTFFISRFSYIYTV